jgi:flagellin
MAITVNTNVASLNAQRNLHGTGKLLNQSLQRLSSGLRINSAKDDAAGLAISNRMNSQIRGLNQAVRNANDGISLAQTAEGALQETTNILQRIRELAIQAANATNSATDRASLNSEVNQLKAELDRIANTTTFNSQKLLDGSFTAMKFHVGAYADETIAVSVAGATSGHLANYTVGGANEEEQSGSGSTTLVSGASLTVTDLNSIAAQELTISVSAGETIVKVAEGDTAYAIAAAINRVSDETGVRAAAKTTATLSELSGAGTITFKLGSGGDTAIINATIDNVDDLSAVATEINKRSGTTGITAEITDGILKMTQAEGKDIRLEDFIHSEGAAITFRGSAEATGVTLAGSGDSSIAAGEVTFNAAASFAVTSTIAAAGGSILNVDAEVPVGSAQQKVSSINISSVAGANSSLVILDAALTQIDSIRADLGAVQNRMEMTIANLMNVSENVAAAKSRILDADFAAETAALTRAHILQQAGLAMLAQANTVPQSALTLLQG